MVWLIIGVGNGVENGFFLQFTYCGFEAIECLGGKLVVWKGVFGWFGLGDMGNELL